MKNVLLLSVTFLFLTFSAQGQWGTEVGDNVQLTTGEGLKLNVLIEPGPNDGWYISYSVATGSNTYVVRLARVDSAGMILWDNIIHDLSAVGNPRAVMISDMSDGVILSWIDRRVSTSPMLYANRIDLDGNKLWGQNDLQIGMTDGEQSCPKIISDGGGGAIVTCRDEGPGNDEFTGIYAHHISAAGSVGWRTFLFPNGNDCSNYSIDTDGQGGLVAFTTYAHVFQMENQVRGMRLDENGTKVWADETFDVGPLSLPIGMRFQGSQDAYSNPIAAFHPSAGIYLVYFHNPIGGMAPLHRGQLIDAGGNKLWADQDIILNQPSVNSPDANLITDLEGNLYFNYHTDSSWNLQKVLSDGTLPFTNDGIAYSLNSTGAPDKLELTTCNDVMILVDDIDDIIHAVRIDENGDMVYNPPLLPISLDQIDDQHRDPVIRINENDRVLAVWVDDENINDNDWDLKMHGFHKNGQLGNITSVESLKSIDFKMYPNPVSNSETLIIETSNITFGNVLLIDSRGKTVLKKGNVDFSGGIATISLSSKLSAGCYLLQIENENRLFSSKLTVY